MTNLKDKTVLVYDFGNFIEVAQRLSRDFGRVLYFMPTVINGWVEHNPYDIGRGVEGIERIYDIWDYYEEVDLWVFTHIHEGGLQNFLKAQGKRVFGSAKAGLLETDRLGFKQLLKQLELPVNGYDTAKGVNELEEKLSKVEHKYIKSSLRGDMETWEHKNSVTSKIEINDLKHNLGIFDTEEVYIIEDAIEAVGEIGCDPYVVNGKFVDNTCTGVEVKDAAYVGRIMSLKDLPKQVTEVNKKFAPVLESYGYCGAFSTEIRVDKKGVGYFIDPTMRFPEPNTALTLEMYDNYSEIIWMIGGGEIPTVEASEKWGVQLIIKSESAKKLPVAVQFPKKYAKFIKIKNLVVDDEGTHWFTPNGEGMIEIGAVVATGKTLKEAKEKATEIAKSVVGFDIKIKYEALDEAQSVIDNLTKNGIKFI